MAPEGLIIEIHPLNIPQRVVCNMHSDIAADVQFAKCIDNSVAKVAQRAMARAWGFSKGLNHNDVVHERTKIADIPYRPM